MQESFWWWQCSDRYISLCQNVLGEDHNFLVVNTSVGLSFSEQTKFIRKSMHQTQRDNKDKLDSQRQFWDSKIWKFTPIPGRKSAKEGWTFWVMWHSKWCVCLIASCFSDDNVDSVSITSDRFFHSNVQVSIGRTSFFLSVSTERENRICSSVYFVILIAKIPVFATAHVLELICRCRTAFFSFVQLIRTAWCLDTNSYSSVHFCNSTGLLLPSIFWS